MVEILVEVSGLIAQHSRLVMRLGRFSHLLEEIEHFSGRGQEKVAKIVQCGEQLAEKNNSSLVSTEYQGQDARKNA
jgi:hypothetical protein